MSNELANRAIVELVLPAEGVFSDDYNDWGNWTSGKVGVGKLKGTKYGISAAAHPEVDIKNLTRAQAIAIYENEYWFGIQGDTWAPAIGIFLFDMSVQHGPDRAIRIMQKAVGTPVDGDVGKHTREAVLSKGDFALPLIVAARLRFYSHIPGDTNDDGWMNRVALASEKAVEIAMGYKSAA